VTGYLNRGDDARPQPAFFFSVVIATMGRPFELSRCLTAIAALRFPRDRFETIVVNDGGEIATEPELEALAGGAALRLVSQPNRGPGAARNAGTAVARGEFIAFIDDDCVPPPDWLDRLAEAIARAPEAMVGGRTINLLTGNLCSQASQSLVEYVYRYYNESGSGRSTFFASNNMALATTLLRGIGGFDERFRTAEDRELCNRWKRLGGAFSFAPDVVIYHGHRLNLWSLQKQHFGYGRGALPYWEKSAARGVRGIRVEPLSFYAGMLRFPFARHERRPAIVSSLILLSQMANAFGFAWEAIRRVAAHEPATMLAGETESAVATWRPPSSRPPTRTL
jgi:GT2 family glycosyltransferase